MRVAGDDIRPRLVARVVVAVIVVALIALIVRAPVDAEPIAEEEAPARENLNAVNGELCILFVLRDFIRTFPIAVGCVDVCDSISRFVRCIFSLCA